MNYSRIYDLLIQHSEERIKTPDYIERHHIIPRCMGGLDDTSNIAILSLREHYIAHILLCKIYPSNDKLIYAMWMMCNRGNIKSSKLYESVRIKYVAMLAGKKLSDETKRKIGNANKGSKRSAEVKTLMSITRKGRKHSEETKKRISEGQKGNIRGPTPKHIKDKIKKNTQQYIYDTPEGTFCSVRDAADVIGLTHEGFRYRINTNNKKWKGWIKTPIRK